MKHDFLTCVTRVTNGLNAEAVTSTPISNKLAPSNIRFELDANNKLRVRQF